MEKKWFIFGALIALAYLAGRFSAPAEIKYRDKEKIVYREKTDEQKERDQNKTVTQVTYPNGKKVSRTRFSSHSSASRKTDSEIQDTKEHEKEVINRKGAIIGVMFGLSPFDLTKGFDAGASANIPLFGPFYFGPWVLFRPDLKVGVNFSFGI